MNKLGRVLEDEEPFFYLQALSMIPILMVAFFSKNSLKNGDKIRNRIFMLE
jgi:hypothetical protein